MDAKLKDQSYDASRASTLCKQMANEVMYAVKSLSYSRYKIVVQVWNGRGDVQWSGILV